MSKSIASLYYKLVEEVATAPLSQLLPSVLALARKLGNQELEKWGRLEMEGYYNTNPALTEDAVVPAYRTIAGQRLDEFRRPLVLRDSRLQFINQDRMRNGVAELEQLATSTGPLSYRDPQVTKMIRETLGVEVTVFTFHPSEIHGVLSGVRTRLVDWLSEIEPDIEKLKSASDQQHYRNGEKEEDPPLTRRRVLLATLFAILVVTGVVFLVSTLVVPTLSPQTSLIVVLLFACLAGVVTVLGNLNGAIELLHKFFPELSSRGESAAASNSGLSERSLCMYFHKNPPYNAVKVLYVGSEIAKDLDVRIIYKDVNGNDQIKAVTDFFPKEDPRMMWHYYQYDFLEPNQVAYCHLVKRASTLDGKATVVVSVTGARSGKTVQVKRNFDLEEY